MRQERPRKIPDDPLRTALAEHDPVAGFVECELLGDLDEDVAVDGERKGRVEQGFDPRFQLAPGTGFTAVVVAGHGEALCKRLSEDSVDHGWPWVFRSGWRRYAD